MASQSLDASHTFVFGTPCPIGRLSSGVWRTDEGLVEDEMPSVQALGNKDSIQSVTVPEYCNDNKIFDVLYFDLLPFIVWCLYYAPVYRP